MHCQVDFVALLISCKLCQSKRILAMTESQVFSYERRVFVKMHFDNACGIVVPNVVLKRHEELGIAVRLLVIQMGLKLLVLRPLLALIRPITCPLDLIIDVLKLK